MTAWEIVGLVCVCFMGGSILLLLILEVIPERWAAKILRDRRTEAEKEQERQKYTYIWPTVLMWNEVLQRIERLEKGAEE